MSYFVRINDATDVRRRTLESSKDLLHILRGYHKILVLRDQKKETTERLRRTMSELGALAVRLEGLLPEETLKEFAVPKAQKAKPKKAEAKPKELPPPPKDEKPKQMSELERLEHALASIEDRLGKL